MIRFQKLITKKINMIAGKEVDKKAFLTALCIVFIVSLLPIIIFSTYSRAVGDDFVYSASLYHMIQSGNWNIFSLIKEACRVSKGFYDTWQGTYASAFLMALQPGIYGEKFYFLGAILLIILDFFSVLFALKTAKKIFCPTLKYEYIISACFAITLLQGMPDIGEGFYYYDAAWHYTAFCFFTLINATLVLNMVYEENKKKRLIYLVLSIIMSLIAAGGSQMPGFLNILVLLLFIVFIDIKKSKYAIVPLAFSVFGFILTLIAPGSVVRREAEAALEGEGFVQPGVIKTIVKCSLQFFRELSGWINITWFAFMVLLIPVAVMFVRGCKCKPKLHPIILIVVFAIILIGMLCVPFYGMGHIDPFGEGRLLDSVWLAFMVFSGISFVYTFIWALGNKDMSRLDNISKRLDVTLVLLLCAFIIGFFPGTSGYNTINEIRFGYSDAYLDSYNNRLELINNHSGDGPLYVKSMDGSTSILEEGDWIDPWGLYYGVDIILVEE